MTNSKKAAVILNLIQDPSCRTLPGLGRSDGQAALRLYPGKQAYGTLYIGVTAHLLARLYQHREGGVPGFTSRYQVFMLVRYEFRGDMPAAIAREKQLKAWRRDWKIALIGSDNPRWEDLAVGLGLEPLGPSARHDGS